MSRISAKLWVGVGALLVFVVGATILSFPPILAVSIEQERAFALMLEQFPVTVNPQEKRIVESEHVNTFLEPNSPLRQQSGNVGNVFGICSHGSRRASKTLRGTRVSAQSQ